MAIKKIYKSRLGASVYVTRVGKPLHFIDGKHITDDEADIMELEAELKRKSPDFSIYVDPAEAEIDTTLQDAIQEARRAATVKVLEDFEKQKAAVSSTSAQVAMVPVQQATMSSATLLGVMGSDALAGLSAPSAS